jgi:hypothetical protein
MIIFCILRFALEIFIYLMPNAAKPHKLFYVTGSGSYKLEVILIVSYNMLFLK